MRGCSPFRLLWVVKRLMSPYASRKFLLKLPASLSHANDTLSAVWNKKKVDGSEN